MTNSAVFEDPRHSGHYANLVPMMTDRLRLDRLRGRSVIDLGCGHGWWGEALLPHGANVSFIDAREENLAAVRQRHPAAATHVMNVETDAFPVARADIVICMGLIYHIPDPAELFKRIAAISDRLFVETISVDYMGAGIVYVDEHTDTSETSVSGKACRPSPRWVMRALRQAGFTEIADISDARGNRAPSYGMPGLLYRWDYETTYGWRRNDCTLRRMFMASKAPRNDDLLIWPDAEP